MDNKNHIIDSEFEKIGLYSHNAQSYKKVRKAYEDGERVVGIVQATGTGKSYQALQLALDNRDKNTLYIVPSNAIAEHIENIIKNNPNLDRERDFPNLKIVTYQSLINMSREELASLNVDLLILDEFHHIGAPVWGARVNDILETHPDMKIFGMTAYTVRDRGTPYERDMANPNGGELFSNKIVNRYDLADAIIDGVLPLPIYRCTNIQLLGIEKMLEEKILSDKFDLKTYSEYREALANIRRRLEQAPGAKELVKSNLRPNSKCIYFCPVGSDIDAIMQEVRGWFSEYKDEDIVFYKSTSSMGDYGEKNRSAFYNDKSLDGEDVSNKLRIIFVINQYNEGSHAPNVDAVILGRATSSEIVAGEQIGRGLAVRENYYEEFQKYDQLDDSKLLELAKERNIPINGDITRYELINKLLAPVIIDLAGNIEFIKELEDDIKDRVKKRRSKEKNIDKRSPVRENISFDLDASTHDLLEIFLLLRDKVFKNKWDMMYELAKNYYDINKNLDVPYTYRTFDGKTEDENGYNLGVWIHTQRYSVRYGRLPVDKVNKLLSIGMDFKKVKKNRTWNEWYIMAKNYYDTYGNLDVPHDFKTSDGVNIDDKDGVLLHSWLGAQMRRTMQLLSIDELLFVKLWRYSCFMSALNDQPNNGPLLKRIDDISAPVSEYKDLVSKDELYKLLSIGILKGISPLSSRRLKNINRFLKRHGLDQQTIADYASIIGMDTKEILSRSYVELEALETYLKNIGYQSNEKLAKIFFMSDGEIEAILGKKMIDIVYDYFPKKEDMPDISIHNRIKK